MQKSKKNRTLHNYHDRVIYRAVYLWRILPTDGGRARPREEEAWMYTPARMIQMSEEEIVGVAPERARRRELQDGPRDARDMMRSTMLQGIAEAEGVRVPHDYRTQARSSSSGGARGCYDGDMAPPAKRHRTENPPPWARGRDGHRDVYRDSHRYGEGRAPGRGRSPSDELCMPPVEDFHHRSSSSTHKSRHAISHSTRVHAEDRSLLICAVPNCTYLVHSDPTFGGFCCRKCHWRDSNASKCKKKHGELCQKLEAPPDAIKAEPIPPDDPMT